MTLQKSPITDRTLNVYVTNKFSDIRKRAHLDEVSRHKKAKKDKKVLLPKFKIGDKVVVKKGLSNPQYCLVDVVDFDEDYNNRFIYFGVIEKTTESSKLERLGRLISFGGGYGWWNNYSEANVEDKGIKWL